MNRVPLRPGAEEQAWQIVRAAFGERERVRRPRSRLGPVLALAGAAVVAGVLASPPGWALIHSFREAVGIEQAEPELFSLPTGGRLLVSSSSGPWIVQPGGSRRLLGRYRDASWSPHGLYLTVTRENELLAVDPKGNVRWTLARPEVRFPRWTGTRTDTRIAYLTTSRLHVVAGDGTDDVDAGGLPAATRIAPAWRPGLPHVLAYADTRGRVYAYDVGAGSDFWSAAPVISAHFAGPRVLEWSSDGSRLLLVARGKLVLFGPRTAAPLSVRYVRGIVTAAFRPGTRQIALVRTRRGAGEVVVGRRVLFRGTGELRDLAWSPDGRWLLVTWPTANQWVFVRVAGPRKLVAVSAITGQFGGGTFPRVDGWCCR